MDSTKRKILEMYRSMLFYYYENIGKVSEIGGALITPKLIAKTTERFLELGGELPKEHYEVCWEDRQKV